MKGMNESGGFSWGYDKDLASQARKVREATARLHYLMRQAHEAGLSIRAIAAVTGIPKDTVRRRLVRDR